MLSLIKKLFPFVLIARRRYETLKADSFYMCLYRDKFFKAQDDINGLKTTVETLRYRLSILNKSKPLA